MARGGKRQGTPGAGYANRTDLMKDYSGAASTPMPTAAPPTAAPAAPSAPQQVGAAAQAGFPAVEDTPFLDSPDDSPHITPGTSPLQDPPGASRDLTVIKKYLPDLRQNAAIHDAPPTFKAFVRWLEQQ